MRSLRTWGTLALGAVGLVAAGWVVLGIGGEARATSRRVDEIVATCRSGIGTNRKAVLIEELCELNNGEAREALEELADSGDDRLAVLAISALAREDYYGGDTKVQGILESSTRSSTARAAALAAYLNKAKRQGKTWSQVRGYAEGECEGNDSLEAMCDAVATKLWGGDR